MPAPSNSSSSNHSKSRQGSLQVETNLPTVIANPIQNIIHNGKRLIRFEYDKSYVLIRLAGSYQEAQAMAKQEFHQFTDVAKERIGFFMDDPILASAKVSQSKVRISESAWLAVMSHLSTDSTIHIAILPDPDAKGPPPQYLEVPTPGLSRSDLSRPSSRSSTRSAHSLFSWIGSGK